MNLRAFLLSGALPRTRDSGLSSENETLSFPSSGQVTFLFSNVMSYLMFLFPFSTSKSEHYSGDLRQNEPTFTSALLFVGLIPSIGNFLGKLQDQPGNCLNRR